MSASIRPSSPVASRALRLLAAATLLAAILPGAALATPSPDTCASNQAITYSAPLPDGLRTPGTHAIQWKAQFTDAATGELVIDDSFLNQLTIDAAAPAYASSVLVRLFRNTALLPGGEVVTVEAMRPDQSASMHVNVSWLKDDKFFTGTFEIAFRYQLRAGRWSSYQVVPAGPTQSFCVETNDAIWRKQYGWG